MTAPIVEACPYCGTIPKLVIGAMCASDETEVNIEQLRADLARVTAEREEGWNMFHASEADMSKLKAKLARVTMELDTERHANLDRIRAAEILLSRALVAESRLAEVEAQAAAMHSVIENLAKYCSRWWSDKNIRDATEHALTADAGRAILDELRALRAVRDAASEVQHGNSQAHKGLRAALEAAKLTSDPNARKARHRDPAGAE